MKSSKLLKQWQKLSQNRWWPVASMVVLWLLAVAVRWYQIPNHLFFGFEQGRDALVVQDIWQLKDYVLVGPKTDIDGVFHGAWYYYLMAIPYGLSKGNPLVASFFLIAMSSLIPPLLWWWGRRLWKEEVWAWVLALSGLLSYELIQYSRWLSNVTPATLGMLLVIICLWQARASQQQKWLIVAAALAGLTAQFEIIATLWFGWLFGVLWVSKWLPLPKVKTLLAMFLAASIWYVPMVLFNFRNENISFISAQKYLLEGKDGEPISAASRIMGYGKQLNRLGFLNLAVKNFAQWWVTAVVMVGGLVVAYRQKTNRPLLGLLAAWLTMTVLVLAFPRSLPLPQLYIGTGISFLVAWVVALRSLWQKPMTKILVVLSLLLWVSKVPLIYHSLQTNSDVFYRTIQDDLNYKDQQAVLSFIHQDSAGQPYRLQPYTIPYYQDQGWRYLYRYFYPHDTAQDAQVVYTITEYAVDPFWAKKWTSEIGETELISEQKFGLIKVEKRKLLPTKPSN